MRKKKIIQMINELTIDDFIFSIDTTKGTINPCEVKLISSKKNLDNTTEYVINVPIVEDISTADIKYHRGVLSYPKNNSVKISELTDYNNYKQANGDYTKVEIKVFYICARLKNSNLINYINNKIRQHCFEVDCRYPCSFIPRVPLEYYYYNWNIPPFITGAKQFTEDDKKRLYEDVKAFLLDAISSV